jgi:hypothetical protein
VRLHLRDVVRLAASGLPGYAYPFVFGTGRDPPHHFLARRLCSAWIEEIRPFHPASDKPEERQGPLLHAPPGRSFVSGFFGTHGPGSRTVGRWLDRGNVAPCEARGSKHRRSSRWPRPPMLRLQHRAQHFVFPSYKRVGATLLPL